VSVRLAVVLPAGPDDDAPDTLASVLAYCPPPRGVVVIDDAGGGHAHLRDAAAGVHVIPTPPGAPGSRGGLYAKLAAGYRFALARLPFDVLLRLDADALVIGPGLARAAAARFAAEPGVGLLGAYRLGPDGGERAFAPAARLLAAETGVRGLRRPALRRTLRAVRAPARAHGYVDGEHALGGCYLHSRAAVAALGRRGFLDLEPLRASRLGEDHLFALLTRAAGLRLGDFGGPGDPLCLRWQGLPAHPEALAAAGKLVAHSVRGHGDLDEAAIRGFFAARRPRPA
jgi:hypothetical protein